MAMQTAHKYYPRLSSWIREANLVGHTPILLSNNLPKINSWLPTYSTAQKSMRLLRNLSLRFPHPGYPINSTQNDYPLAWSNDLRELEYHFRSLESEGYIKFSGAGENVQRGYQTVEILPKGWAFLEHGGGGRSNIVFVAMSFSDSLSSIWNDGLKKGIEGAGYTAQRVDSVPHVQRIDQKIIADIRSSEFVVADVTENRPGVYFEAGFALGLGKTVIWTVLESDIGKVHFDTRQFAHILWQDADHLAT